MSYVTKAFDEQIVKLLKSGSVGFMPSDTIYGLSTLALDEAAVNSIYKIKGRDDGKPLIILMSSLEQAEVLGLAQDDLEIMKQFWPAPITFICPTSWSTPEYLHKGLETLAVRIPDSKQLRDLIEKTGPLVSTSANLQGQPTIQDIEEARLLFSENIDFYVDGGRLDDVASTIVKIENKYLLVLRQGSYVFNGLGIGKKIVKTL